MRTSLNELKKIEDYLLGKSSVEDRLLFEARLSLESDLNHQLLLQQEAYAEIHQYGRRQLKKEIAAVQHELYNSPKHLGFRQKLLRIFRN